MIGEFEFIHNIKSRFNLKSVGDDCAVLPKDDVTDSLLTADLLIEDIDFRLEWTSPEFLGHKALAVSLSDIAAMGGTPKWAMLSLGVSENLWKTNFLDEFYNGWFELAKKHDVELVGGDISRSPGKLVIDSIVGGECFRGRAILRSDAKPGNAIFVTGSLGAAAGGLKLLETGKRFDSTNNKSEQALMSRQLKPIPQMSASKLLMKLQIATTMIDISDGLSADLAHVCKQSGVGAKLYAERLPIDPALASHFPPEKCLDFALHGGEDFELLLTADKTETQRLESIGFTHIGEITSKVGIIELSHDDKSVVLIPKGFRHF